MDLNDARRPGEEAPHQNVPGAGGRTDDGIVGESAATGNVPPNANNVDANGRPAPRPSPRPVPPPKDDVAIAREAVALLSPTRAQDRDTWIKVGMALQAVSVGLLPEWIEFSRQSDKFKEGECEKLWRGFKPDKAQSLGLGSLIRWARDDSGDQDFAKGSGGEVPPANFETLESAAATLAGLAGGRQGGLWKYHDLQGNEIFAVVRIDLPGVDPRGKPNKTFRPIRKAGNRYVTGDPKGALPLYRLPKLPADGPIILVEGEKAAAAGAEIGLVTTTSAHGAQSPAKSDWSPLKDRDVLILPDNDLAGIGYAQKAGAILEKLDPPARVRAWMLSEVPPGGDLVEFIQARRAAGRSDPEIREEIVSLASTAGGLAGLAGDGQRAQAIFPDPVPLPSDRPPVPPLEFDLVPQALEPWLRDIALRMQCAADFLFAAVMVALATVIGKKVGIRPKRYDTWLVVVNLWGGVIGRPGILKSPAVQEALRPLRNLEDESRSKFKDEMREFDQLKHIAKAKRKALEKDLRKAVESEEDDGGSEEIAKQLVNVLPDCPSWHRYFVNDSTVEKLGEILAQNANGVLVYRDELVGLLKDLDKEGQEGARAFYLQAWNGDSNYTYDRIMRGTVVIESAIVSIFGSIQPGPLREYVVGAAAYGKADDGLLQRFQILVFPDQTKDWKNHDRLPNHDAREAAFEVFRRLDQITVLSADAEVEFGQTGDIPFLHFDNDAQIRFDAWRDALERRLRSGEEEEIFESYLAKHRSLVPSLALIYHLVDVGYGPVKLASLERAIRAAIYLEGHARRVYASALNPELGAAHALAKRILSRKVQSPFTLRDVYQNGWSLLTSATEVGKAVDVLVDYDWLVKDKSQGPTGAPKTSYSVNPKIWSCPPEGSGKTSKKEGGGQGINGDAPQEGTSKTGRSPEAATDSPGQAGHGTFKTGRSPEPDGSTGDLFDDDAEGGMEGHDA